MMKVAKRPDCAIVEGMCDAPADPRSIAQVAGSDKRPVIAAILLVAVAGTALLDPAPASARNEVGSEEHFTLQWAGPSIKVAAYRPGSATQQSPVVIVLHGAERNASLTYRRWKRLSARFGFTVIVPEFSLRAYPGARYTLGGPPGKGSLDSIVPLFRTVRSRLHLCRDSFSLYGHSAGAQLVHRFLLLNPSAPVDQAIVSEAGWFTMLDFATAWPNGLGGTAVEPRTLAPLFARNVTIVVGDKDRDPNDRRLRRNPTVDRQGITRLDRGIAFFTGARTLAQSWGDTFGWRLEVMRDVAHDGGRSAEFAAPLLGTPTPPPPLTSC
jgi:hypothetical protein